MQVYVIQFASHGDAQGSSSRVCLHSLLNTDVLINRAGLPGLEDLNW